VSGERLVEWLAALPERANAPQRAAYVTALAELRDELSQSPSATEARQGRKLLTNRDLRGRTWAD
jgi:hypothetical protein